MRIQQRPQRIDHDASDLLDGELEQAVLPTPDVERFSTAAAPELRPLGIAINALRPGAVRTEQTSKEFGPDFDWSGWATPESVVAPVAFLAAQTGTELTGRVLDVADFRTAWGLESPSPASLRRRQRPRRRYTVTPCATAMRR